MSDPPVLEAEAVRRRYGGRWVVDVARLALRRGEVLAVLGPNGSGKSTLFRLLLLLERADAGVVRIDGRPAGMGDREAQARLAGVFQRPILFSGTVRANVEYGLRARRVAGKERRARAADALALLGLTHLASAPVSALSGGEAQRVALARALALRPDALLLDEPTANLDVTARQRFREELAGLARTGAGAALVITHDPADAFALADRVAVLQDGRVVQVGTPDDLVLRPSTPFVAAFTGAELIGDARLDRREGGAAIVTVPGGARLRGTEAGDVRSLTPGAPVVLAYRPEDVRLRLPDGSSSDGNLFNVQVDAVTPAGGWLRLRLAGDLPLTALLARGEAAALGVAPGTALAAELPPSALRVYAAVPSPPVE